MKNLIASNPSMFPLRASLFYKRPNGQPGSTWDYLARDTVNQTQEVINKQVEYNSNCMTSLIFNMVDPNEHPVNPFVGNPTAAQIMAGQNMIDMAEIVRWHPLINWGKDPNLWFIPTWFCGDDRATTNNTAFHEWFLPGAIPFIDQYADAHNICIEASKSLNIQQQVNLINFMRRFTSKPIGVHNQGWNIAPNADFLMYEFSWNPWNAFRVAQMKSKGFAVSPEQENILAVNAGDNHTIAEVISEAKKVLDHYPKYVWFQEMNIYPECQRAREQAEAIRDYAKSEPRIIGLPGPV